jgi:hypothetical protein
VALALNPRAFADAMPAFRLCSRSARVMALRFPLLRLPRADMTAEMVAFEGDLDMGSSIREASFMPTRLARWHFTSEKKVKKDLTT